jgi:hypothetical protein
LTEPLSRTARRRTAAVVLIPAAVLAAFSAVDLLPGPPSLDPWNALEFSIWLVLMLSGVALYRGARWSRAVLVALLCLVSLWSATVLATAAIAESTDGPSFLFEFSDLPELRALHLQAWALVGLHAALLIWSITLYVVLLRHKVGGTAITNRQAA